MVVVALSALLPLAHGLLLPAVSSVASMSISHSHNPPSSPFRFYVGLSGAIIQVNTGAASFFFAATALEEVTASAAPCIAAPWGSELP